MSSTPMSWAETPVWDIHIHIYIYIVEGCFRARVPRAKRGGGVKPLGENFLGFWGVLALRRGPRTTSHPCRWEWGAVAILGRAQGHGVPWV